MIRSFTLYQRDYARQGKQFVGEHDKALLEREGWMDNVKKMGPTKWERNNPRSPDRE